MTTTKRTRTLRIGLLVGCAVVGSALVGCAGTGTLYSDMDAAPSAKDALPDVVESRSDDADTPWDQQTSRYVGSFDGDEVWIAAGTEEGYVCLAVVPEDGAWSMGCGGVTGKLEVGKYVLLPDSMVAEFDDESTATKVSNNVFRR